MQQPVNLWNDASLDLLQTDYIVQRNATIIRMENVNPLTLRVGTTGGSFWNGDDLHVNGLTVDTLFAISNTDTSFPRSYTARFDDTSLRLVIDSFNVPAGCVDIRCSTHSTSSSTGALVVEGGFGLAEDANVGGSIHVTADVVATGGMTLGGGLLVNGTSSLVGSVLSSITIASTQASTSPTTGALVLSSGGLGVTGDVNIGGSLNFSNQFYNLTSGWATYAVADGTQIVRTKKTGNSVTVWAREATAPTTMVDTLAFINFAGGLAWNPMDRLDFFIPMSYDGVNIQVVLRLGTDGSIAIHYWPLFGNFVNTKAVSFQSWSVTYAV